MSKALAYLAYRNSYPEISAELINTIFERQGSTRKSPRGTRVVGFDEAAVLIEEMTGIRAYDIRLRALTTLRAYLDRAFPVGTSLLVDNNENMIDWVSKKDVRLAIWMASQVVKAISPSIEELDLVVERAEMICRTWSFSEGALARMFKYGSKLYTASLGFNKDAVEIARSRDALRSGVYLTNAVGNPYPSTDLQLCISAADDYLRPPLNSYDAKVFVRTALLNSVVALPVVER